MAAFEGGPRPDRNIGSRRLLSRSAFLSALAVTAPQRSSLWDSENYAAM